MDVCVREKGLHFCGEVISTALFCCTDKTHAVDYEMADFLRLAEYRGQPAI
jgi:hypothetical protein